MSLGLSTSRPCGRPVRLLAIALVALTAVSCVGNDSADEASKSTQRCPTVTPQRLEPRIVRRIPHDPTSYTQGLVLWGADSGEPVLFESAGLYGKSKLSALDPRSGSTHSSVALDDGVFAEGLALVEASDLVQLTWKEGLAFRWRVDGFDKSSSPFNTFSYEGEGWGLTTLGQDTGAGSQRLLMSDGSDTLVERDPRTFDVTKGHTVRREGGRADMLNELEWDGRWVWANRYQTNEILRIDTRCWAVTAVVDASNLRREVEVTAGNTGAEIDVLNGIAFDSKSGTYLVTGKLWPTLFEVDFVPAD